MLPRTLSGARERKSFSQTEAVLFFSATYQFLSSSLYASNMWSTLDKRIALVFYMPLINKIVIWLWPPLYQRHCLFHTRLLHDLRLSVSRLHYIFITINITTFLSSTNDLSRYLPRVWNSTISVVLYQINESNISEIISPETHLYSLGIFSIRGRL